MIELIRDALYSRLKIYGCMISLPFSFQRPDLLCLLLRLDGSKTSAHPAGPDSNLHEVARTSSSEKNPTFLNTQKENRKNSFLTSKLWGKFPR